VLMSAAGYILLALGALVSLGNRGLVFRWYLARKHSSLVPFIGGLSSFVGCSLLSVLGWKRGLLGVVLDPGCVWLLLAIPIESIRRRRSGRGTAHPRKYRAGYRIRTGDLQLGNKSKVT
jgi:hypothetical protein